MSESFTLDPRLEADSIPVIDLPLSALRLMNDANYPWLLLIPRQNQLVELIDLDDSQQIQLTREIAFVSKALRKITECHKLNVAALGNQVAQLHVHIIGRFESDPAWPGPVWGHVPVEPYRPEEQHHVIKRIVDELTEQ